MHPIVGSGHGEYTSRCQPLCVVTPLVPINSTVLLLTDLLSLPVCAGAVNNLAGLLKHQGVYDEAAIMYKRALEGRRKVLGSEHPATLTTLNDLGSLLQAQGRCVKVWTAQLGATAPKGRKGEQTNSGRRQAERAETFAMAAHTVAPHCKHCMT